MGFDDLERAVAARARLEALCLHCDPLPSPRRVASSARSFAASEASLGARSGDSAGTLNLAHASAPLPPAQVGVPPLCSRVLCVGSMCLDTSAWPRHGALRRGGSVPGRVMQGPGGVARNVAAATLGITTELEAFAVGARGSDGAGAGPSNQEEEASDTPSPAQNGDAPSEASSARNAAAPSEASSARNAAAPSEASSARNAAAPSEVSSARNAAAFSEAGPSLHARALTHSRSPIFLSGPVRLVSAVGDDAAGRLLLESWRVLTMGFGEPGDRCIRVVPGGATPSVSVIYDGGGDVAASVADVDLVEAALSPADVRDAVRAGLVGPPASAAPQGQGGATGGGGGGRPSAVSGGPGAAADSAASMPVPALSGTTSPSRTPYSPSALPAEPEAVSEGEITGLLPANLRGRALGAALAAQAAADVELRSEEAYRAAAVAMAMDGAREGEQASALGRGAAEGAAISTAPAAAPAPGPPLLEVAPPCPPIVVLDANLTAAALLAGAAEAHRLGARVWVEPTSAPKAKRAVHCARACWVISPNVDELLALADELDPVHALGVGAHGDRGQGGSGTGAGALPHALVRAAGDRLGRALREVAAHAGALGVVLRSGIEYVVLTLGKAGVAIVCAEPKRSAARDDQADDRAARAEGSGQAAAGGAQATAASTAALPTPAPLPSQEWRWGDRRVSSQPPRKLRSLRVALIPAPEVPRNELKSATGAGDALVAGAVAALARGSDLLGAVLLGSAAAGRALRAPGPTPAEGWNLPEMLREADLLQQHVLEVSIPLVGVGGGRALL